MLCFHPMKTNHAMQLTNLNWNCFEGRQTKKHTEPEFEKTCMDHWPRDKKHQNYSARFGQKISFRPSGTRTDREQAVCVELGVVAVAVLGNCILIAS